jgi:hypothetical protein
MNGLSGGVTGDVTNWSGVTHHPFGRFEGGQSFLGTQPAPGSATPVSTGDE